MIKIIKKGTRRQEKCENCGCIFTYEEEDTLQNTSCSIASCYNYVECPQCNKKIKVGRVPK